MMKVFPLLAAVAFISLSPYSPAAAHEDNAAVQSSPQADQQPFDIQFLDTMSHHHDMGIEMMQMAVDKAQSPDIKNMAQKMLDDQKKEISELAALKQKVKPNAPIAVNMELPGMEPMDHSKLENASGAEFDRIFLDMTIKHHGGAVEMSDAALKQAENTDVRAKAQAIHDKQKAEIDQMQSMKTKLGD